MTGTRSAVAAEPLVPTVSPAASRMVPNEQHLKEKMRMRLRLRMMRRKKESKLGKENQGEEGIEKRGRKRETRGAPGGAGEKGRGSCEPRGGWIRGTAGWRGPRERRRTRRRSSGCAGRRRRRGRSNRSGLRRGRPTGGRS